MASLGSQVDDYLARFDALIASLPDLPTFITADNWPAWLALCFSLIALFASLSRRQSKDDYKIKTSSQYVRSKDGQPDTVVIKLENTGSKPVLLSMAWGRYSDGSTKGQTLEGPRGVRIGVGENYTEAYEDYMALNANAAHLVDLWYEDFLGQEYNVAGAGKVLRQLTR